MVYETDPPGMEPLDTAIIGRVTTAERRLVGRFAETWDMSVSGFVRFATLRYIQLMLDKAADMAEADLVIEESAHLAVLDRQRVRG